MHFWQFPLNFALHYKDKNELIKFAHNYRSRARLN